MWKKEEEEEEQQEEQEEEQEKRNKNDISRVLLEAWQDHWPRLIELASQTSCPCWASDGDGVMR